jgi:hypothetical protein
VNRRTKTALNTYSTLSFEIPDKGGQSSRLLAKEQFSKSQWLPTKPGQAESTETRQTSKCWNTGDMSRTTLVAQ